MLGSDSDWPKYARFGHEFMIETDRQVMAFTNEQIRVIVDDGKFTDPRVLPLDRFEVRAGQLAFEDLVWLPFAETI